MNRAKKYFFNALLLSCVTIVMRAVSVSFNAYVTQKIGSEAVGLFTLVMSVYTFAITLATSGVNLAAVRLTAEKLAYCEEHHSSEKALKKALRGEMLGCIIYSLFFGIFSAFLLHILSSVIGIYLLQDPRTVLSLKVLSFALPAISLSSALAGYFTGLRKVYKNAVISFVEQIIKIGITSMALVFIAPRGIEYACLSVVGGSAISEGASLILSFMLYIIDKNKGYGTSEKRSEHGESALSRAFNIAFPVAAGSYVRQGLLCAEHIAIPAGLRKFGSGGSGALSSYGTLHAMAFPLIFFPTSVIGAFASLLIPELCEFESLGQEKQVKRISEKVVRTSLLFSICCAGIFLAFGKEMGQSIYSNGEAGRYIRAFAPLVPVMYLDTAVDSVLKGIGKQLYCMKVNIADSFLSLVLVLILVPKFGTSGYVVCVYAAELINAALSIGKMITETKAKISPSWILRPLCSILISVISVKLISSYFSFFDETYLKLPLCVLVYSALIIPKGVFFIKKSYKREKATITP